MTIQTAKAVAAIPRFFDIIIPIAVTSKDFEIPYREMPDSTCINRPIIVESNELSTSPGFERFRQVAAAHLTFPC
jgi:hypothetical protein